MVESTQQLLANAMVSFEDITNVLCSIEAFNKTAKEIRNFSSVI